MKVALDTQVISRYLANMPDEVGAVNKLDDIYLPYFVVAELMAGYEGGIRAKESLQILKLFLARDGVNVLEAPDASTRQLYARIYGQLKKAGKMISITDIWIASECILAGVELFSNDKDMNQIQQLLRYYS